MGVPINLRTMIFIPMKGVKPRRDFEPVTPTAIDTHLPSVLTEACSTHGLAIKKELFRTNS